MAKYMEYLHWNERIISDFSDSNVTAMYERGYVFTRKGKGVMQQTRSVRVDLSKFELSSENRRILKKVSDISLSVKGLPIADYDFKLGKLAKDFYDEKSATTLRNYPAIGNDDRETSYFLRMYLSCYRAAEYLTQRPDWNGKTLVVMGDSQGGLQTFLFAFAGLVAIAWASWEVYHRLGQRRQRSDPAACTAESSSGRPSPSPGRSRARP